MIPYSTQHIDQSDIDAVIEALKAPMLTQGPMVEQFEQAVCNRVNATHGVAMNSATSALHAACRAVGIGKGDTVWVPAISFAATANCVRYCGADVEFIDINADNFNLDPIELWNRLNLTKKAPKAIIVTHMGGYPADMADIRQFADSLNCFVIEDAAHALGATYRSKPVGSLYSDITVFSFHPVKPITTGEGGMAVTNNLHLANKMRAFRTHGMVKTPTEEEPWKQEITELGMNYRMTEISAALGLSQLKRLDSFIERRKEIRDRYFYELYDYGYCQPESIDRTSSHHLHITTYGAKWWRNNVYHALKAEGFATQVHYPPIYYHPYYERIGMTPEQRGYPTCAEAEEYYDCALSLPIHHHLTDEQQTKIIDTIKRAS